MFWVFEEPELLVNQYPLAFHQSENKSLKTANMSEAWKHKKRENDKYLGLSEINAGQGIFRKSHAVNIEIGEWYQQNKIKLLTSLISGIYENEKKFTRKQTFPTL